MDIGLLRSGTLPQVIAEVMDVDYFDTSHSSFCNFRGYVGRCGYMSQENIHSYYRNWVTRVYVEERGGYRSQNSDCSFHNQGEYGRFLTLPVSTRCVEGKVHEKEEGGIRFDDGIRGYRSKEARQFYSYNIGDIVGGDRRVLYRSHNSHSSSQRGYIRGDIERHGSRSEYISHFSLLIFGESVDGYGRSGYRSQTRPSPSHHSGDIGRS